MPKSPWSVSSPSSRLGWRSLRQEIEPGSGSGSGSGVQSQSSPGSVGDAANMTPSTAVPNSPIAVAPAPDAPDDGPGPNPYHGPGPNEPNFPAPINVQVQVHVQGGVGNAPWSPRAMSPLGPPNPSLGLPLSPSQLTPEWMLPPRPRPGTLDRWLLLACIC